MTLKMLLSAEKSWLSVLMIFSPVLTEPLMILVVVFSVLNLFQVLIKSLLNFVVKKVTSMSCFLLLHPWIPLPWLSNKLMAKTNKKNQQWCDHCQRPYHTKTTCWKLHGKPADWVPHHLCSPDSKGISATSNSATASNPDLPFSPTQLDQLSKLLASSTTSLIAHGTALASIAAPSTKTKPWIIDSDASDYMTGTCSFVFSLFSVSW